MLWHFLFWEILNLNEPDVAVCRFRLRANVNFHHVTKFSIDLSFILLSQLLVVPVVYTVTVAMTMAILMPPVWSWCIFWKPCIKPCYRSNGSKSKGAIGQVIHGSLHIDSLICYLLYLVYHYISYVYPSNTTVYPVYPYISSVPMFTLVILYTPIYPVYPCLPK